MDRCRTSEARWGNSQVWRRNVVPEHIRFGVSVAGSNGELKAQCTECGGVQSQPSLFDLSFFFLSSLSHSFDQVVLGILFVCLFCLIDRTGPSFTRGWEHRMCHMHLKTILCATFFFILAYDVSSAMYFYFDLLFFLLLLLHKTTHCTSCDSDRSWVYWSWNREQVLTMFLYLHLALDTDKYSACELRSL